MVVIPLFYHSWFDNHEPLCPTKVQKGVEVRVPQDLWLGSGEHLPAQPNTLVYLHARGEGHKCFEQTLTYCPVCRWMRADSCCGFFRDCFPHQVLRSSSKLSSINLNFFYSSILQGFNWEKEEKEDFREIWEALTDSCSGFSRQRKIALWTEYVCVNLGQTQKKALNRFYSMILNSFLLKPCNEKSTW